MTRTNTRIQTTTPVSDCACKAKASPTRETWTKEDREPSCPQPVSVERAKLSAFLLADLGDALEIEAGTGDARYPTPTLTDIRYTYGDCIRFLNYWMFNNAPADVCAIFDESQRLEAIGAGANDKGEISFDCFSRREVMASIFAAKAKLCELYDELEAKNGSH